jgi:UPF0716 family protein affecting phage T7 exclusion
MAAAVGGRVILLALFVILLGLAWCTLEVWVYIRLARHYDDFLKPLLAQVVLSVIGINRVRAHVGKIKALGGGESFQAGLMAAVISNRAGRHFAGIVGGILLVPPGFLKDIAGLLLVLPGCNQLAGKLGNVVVASIIRTTLKRQGFPMGAFPPGGFPPGGFPGFPGQAPNQFPGFKPRTKIIDTKPEP